MSIILRLSVLRIKPRVPFDGFNHNLGSRGRKVIILRHKKAMNPLVQKSGVSLVSGTTEKEISQNQGPSITNSGLGKPHNARTTRIPGLGQRIERKTWENDQLRQRLELEQRKYLYILGEVQLVVESLQRVLLDLHEIK
jgi:hypothetical protein